MPRIRGVEVPQRPSATGPTPRGPRHLRTSSSDSDPLHQRPLTERSPRILDRRSPKGSQSDPLNQKKLGTRITDLETQLVQAQHELKNLKHQLSSAEAAKKQAQEELTKKAIKKPIAVKKVVKREKLPPVAKVKGRSSRDSPDNDIHPETDVFEVPVEKMLVESKEAHSLESELSEETEKPSSSDPEVRSSSKNEDIEQFKAMVEEKEKEKQVLIEENKTLKQDLERANLQIAVAQGKEEELTEKLNQVKNELEARKVNEAKLKDKLIDGISAKESMENEMKMMKVQTEQWRKAADAAAAVLAGGVDINSRISDRCASMDNHFNGMFEPPIDGFGAYLGLPEAGDDTDDGFGREKKRNSGMKMFGDLWKKKGHK